MTEEVTEEVKVGKLREGFQPEVAAVAVALNCLGQLLRYAVEPNWISDEDAAREAAEGIRVLSALLSDWNL